MELREQILNCTTDDEFETLEEGIVEAFGGSDTWVEALAAAVEHLEEHPEARDAAPLYLLRQDLLDWGCEDLPSWMPAPAGE